MIDSDWQEYLYWSTLGRCLYVLPLLLTALGMLYKVFTLQRQSSLMLEIGIIQTQIEN